MELKPQFDAFLASIRPSVQQKESWKVGSSTLRARLAADETLGPQVVSTFLQGSIRRATAIKPTGGKRPDVDVVVVTDIDPLKTTPDQAMSRFIPFLEKHYSGKWRPQGRSFGIELSYVDIDLVITALPPDLQSRSAMEILYRSQSVNTLTALDEQTDWRLNKSWTPSVPNTLNSLRSSPQITQDAPSDEWKPNPLFLPDRDVGNWGRTHPLAQIQWTASKNRECNKLYLDIVRAIKWWRIQNVEILPNYPKGYPLEHMVGYSLANGTKTVGSGIVEVFETMKQQWAVAAEIGQVPVLADHGVPEHNVLKRLTAEDFKAFHKAAGDAASIARDALDNPDAQESGKLWQRLFKASFPLPGPNGGDRVGFTAPAKPAEPRDARFA
ncbi:SMODS domain-containing nucleotidyltransferase [Rhizobium rhizogenes]|jgi:hypothetical protein|uniref:SMODS domain-containing nucleotidyltransferase n=1 Tax=Rhizobium rhizogenes TaxID=359 RepID=UPI0015743992|nr:hypothetical protein [Rhizobium rhizogenes]NTF49065.1 hypothetical protein [Rhizobium rhizogenes]NTH06449.1 hypothetical protein [Rhizobium rhizogenes]NTH51583.1 hypothetical protein [Rhizobium rhizogenes]NTH71167.1 hypothetical protein [Rhizobium rhizogenes]